MWAIVKCFPEIGTIYIPKDTIHAVSYKGVRNIISPPQYKVFGSGIWV